MSGECSGILAMTERLTRLETVVSERAGVVDRQLSDFKDTLKSHGEILEAVRGDIRDSKTALRVGVQVMAFVRWLVVSAVAAGGWAAGHFWPK